MAFCRFSDGDVYLYEDVAGGYTCCACHLAPLVETVFTTGLPSTDSRQKLFKVSSEPCPHCGGTVCEKCGMHGNAHMETIAEALNHLQEHRDAGDVVPDYAFEALQRELEKS